MFRSDTLIDTHKPRYEGHSLIKQTNNCTAKRVY